jgi:hypothetical protein
VDFFRGRFLYLAFAFQMIDEGEKSWDNKRSGSGVALMSFGGVMAEGLRILAVSVVPNLVVQPSRLH